MRGVSRLSRSVSGFADIAISRSALESQISEARNRGDTETYNRLMVQRRVLDVGEQSAQENLFFEAGRSRSDLMAERRQQRLELRQVRRGERRLRDEFADDRRTGKTSMEFEDWVKNRNQPGTAQGELQQGFQTFLQAVMKFADAVNQNTRGVGDRRSRGVPVPATG
jgi:hypothetical protein